MRKTLAKWLVVGALAAFGFVAGAQVAAAQTPTPTPGTNTTADNSSNDSSASSGDSSGSNGANASSGPGSSDFEGDTSGTVVQDGDNEAEVNQSGTSRSGDSVAGSQVTGVVSSGGSTSVTASNTSDGAEATSGDATVNNTANVTVGPRVFGGSDGAAADFEGSVSSVIAQDGDNSADVSQSSLSETGDAVAGAQITGIVGAGDIAVDSTNIAEDPEAETGDATTDNDSTAEAGPFVTGTAAAPEGAGSGRGGDSGGRTASSSSPLSPGVQAAVMPSGSTVGARDFEGPVSSVIAQDGDNEVSTTQNAESTSGDAVAGGQVTGLVASEAGSISIVQQQSSEDADAVSGDAESSNTDPTFAGPRVFSSTADGVAPPGGGAGSADFEGSVDATIAQDGDNEVESNQSATSNSGDAVAGAQIVGLVADGGSSDIVLSNTSEDAEAESGEASAENTADNLFAGPIVATGAFTFGAGSSDFEGDVSGSSIVQDGDNDVELGQNANSDTGDAVAGAQIVGAVTSNGGDVAIDASNSSEDDEAESGESFASNDADNVFAGPLNLEGATFTAGSSDFEGDVTDVDIAQDGDNEADVAQSSDSASGDAVAGGQIFGIVASGSVGIVADNTSDDSDAQSGSTEALNDVDNVFAGPLNFAGSTTAVGSEDFEGDVSDTDIAQDGSNETTLGQSSDAASGDAVAGAAIFGVVTGDGGDVAIDATNTSEDADAESGESNADNDAGNLFAGPLNAAGAAFTAGSADFEGDVTGGGIAQDGDNDLTADQSSSSASGDAVAGGQVMGVVASGSVDIVAANTSDDADAESGEAEAGSDIGNAFAGPLNFAGATTTVTSSDFEGDVSDTDIAQDGDNDASLSQSNDAASGDAVAGGQVMGVVSSGGVAIDATNVSEDDEAESGEASANSDIGNAFAGPINASGGAFTSSAGASDFEGDVSDTGIAQDGDNDLTADQSSSSASGDAVAGGQVMGVVAAGDVAIVASNTSEDADATSGDADADNSIGNVFAGPLNFEGATTTVAADFEGSVSGADIAQDGDNDMELGQSADADSGDAVAGAQVMGVVTSAGGSVAIDATNVSEDSEANSGDSDSSNAVGNAFVGPITASGGTFTVGSSDFEGPVSATIAQDGDNDFSANQTLGTDSGDAVSGGQVIGVVASGSVDIVQSNTSEDDESETGSGTGSNALDFTQIGPFVPGVASAEFGAFFA